MNFLAKTIEILGYKATTPTMFGSVHIISFVLVILLAVFLCVRFKNADERTVRVILLIASVTAIVLEIYKQFIFSFSYDGQTVSFDYQWYAFPFQFCSTPMYIQLLAALIKKGALRNTLCAFLATYGVFAGLAVMLYPADVYIDIIGINIQTMVCHGLMVSVGIFLLARYVRLEHKTMLKAMTVFASCVGVAMILNEIAFRTGFMGDETFNMFFISPHFPPSLPVYSLVQKIIPFPFSVIVYILGFSLAAYAILLIAMGIRKISGHASKKRALRAQ